MWDNKMDGQRRNPLSAVGGLSDQNCAASETKLFPAGKRVGTLPKILKMGGIAMYYCGIRTVQCKYGATAVDTALLQGTIAFTILPENRFRQPALSQWEF